jgi:nicotinamidase-related amidase
LCRRWLFQEGRGFVLPGSKGAELVDDLKTSPDIVLDHSALLRHEIQKIGPDENVIYKPRWGGFYKTPLESHLRKREISTLVVCGCNFPNCPRTTLYEAGERDFRLVLVRDAVSGLYPKALSEMRDIGVTVLLTPEILSLRSG